MKFVAFDIEIAKIVEGDDWQAQRPLGISCAAIFDGENYRIYTAETALSPTAARAFIDDLDQLYPEHLLVSWNGAAFDWLVLAEESGEWGRCRNMAWFLHWDLMLSATARLGHFVGLDAAARGCGIAGKLKSVKLRDGTVVEGMNGAAAPRLWAQGETEAVLAYLKEDVRVTYELAQHVARTGVLSWVTRAGKDRSVAFGPETAGHAVARWHQAPPDTSWMSSPPDVGSMTAWLREGD